MNEEYVRNIVPKRVYTSIRNVSYDIIFPKYILSRGTPDDISVPNPNFQIRAFNAEKNPMTSLTLNELDLWRH